jgi:hypothetical protein
MTNWESDAAIAILTAILVLITAIYAYLTYGILQSTQRQAIIQENALAVQNALLQAQVLSQRFEMYWKTYAPATDEELAQVDLMPEDWMNPSNYDNKYKNDRNALRRYVTLVKIYEYLALVSTMEKLKLKDPLGDKWAELWAADLSKKPEFEEINVWYREYYPEFAKSVETLISRANQSAGAAIAGAS